MHRICKDFSKKKQIEMLSLFSISFYKEKSLPISQGWLDYCFGKYGDPDPYMKNLMLSIVRNMDVSYYISMEKLPWKLSLKDAYLFIDLFDNSTHMRYVIINHILSEWEPRFEEIDSQIILQSFSEIKPLLSIYFNDKESRIYWTKLALLNIDFFRQTVRIKEASY